MYIYTLEYIYTHKYVTYTVTKVGIYIAADESISMYLQPHIYTCMCTYTHTYISVDIYTHPSVTLFQILL